MLRVISLFSGIGGIDLGLEATGYFKTVLFNEIDPFCQKVLKRHWPDVPIIADVKDVNGKEIQADVVVGGFPCQPFSVAGKKGGSFDERYLWPEMLRVIKDAKPFIVIGENVPGIINLSLGLETCIFDLETAGYEVQCFNIPACGVQAPHRRYRVFIIAMANIDIKRLQGYGEKYQLRESKREKQTSGNSWWKSEPNVDRVAYGIPFRVDRIKALGNAVVPQISYVIGMCIANAIKRS
jgi:DNA (cytosine-5)-methyltransferase 1